MTTYLTFDAYGLLTMAASIISFSVGILILTSDYKSKLHRSFSMIAIFGATWLFTFSMAHMVSRIEDAYTWMALDYSLAVPYIAPSVYLFSLYWKGETRASLVAKLGFAIGFALSIVAAFFTPEIFAFQETTIGRFNLVQDTAFARIYFGGVMATFTAFSVLAMRNFWTAWRDARAVERKSQCRVFLIAATIGYTGTIDKLVATGVAVYPFGYLSFSAFALLIAYAIIRYRFLNIDVFIKKASFIFLIYAVLAAMVLPLSIPLIKFIGVGGTGQTAAFFSLSLLSGLALSTGPLIYTYLSRHNAWVRNLLGAGITHELRTPLAAIQSAVDMLSSTNGKRSEDLAPAYVEMIASNAKRLDRLVSDLLDYAKLHDQEAVIERKTFDLSAVVSEVIEEQTPSFRARGLTINFTPGIPCLANGDEKKIKQVVSNLVSNALKFSSAGSRVTIETSVFREHVNFSVTDQGEGIDPGDAPFIFDHFYSGKHSRGGSGVGLSIAKAWVEAHGGRIWAESKGRGMGTAMRFNLPADLRER